MINKAAHMKRIRFNLGLIAVVAIAVVTQVAALTTDVVTTLVGAFVLALLTAFIVRSSAGWQAAKRHSDDPVMQGAEAGMLTGVRALFGAVPGFAILLSVLGMNPEVQDFIRSSEPHPEARIPIAWIPSLGAATGAIVGFVVGMFDLAASTIGGLVAGMVNRGRRIAA
jgi:hypothetical protein